jgi:hypothetical protein
MLRSATTLVSAILVLVNEDDAAYVKFELDGAVQTTAADHFELTLVQP